MWSDLTFDPFFKVRSWTVILKVFISLIMSTGGGHIIFAFSAVRHHTWFLVISRKSLYPIFTKFGMGVHLVNSLHGIYFGEDSFIAN